MTALDIFAQNTRQLMKFHHELDLSRVHTTRALQAISICNLTTFTYIDLELVQSKLRLKIDA